MEAENFLTWLFEEVTSLNVTRNNDGTHKLEICLNSEEGRFHVNIPRAMIKIVDGSVNVIALSDDNALIERQPHVVSCEHCIYKRGYTAKGNVVCNFDLLVHKSDWFCPRGKEAK